MPLWKTPLQAALDTIDRRLANYVAALKSDAPRDEKSLTKVAEHIDNALDERLRLMRGAR